MLTALPTKSSSEWTQIIGTLPKPNYSATALHHFNDLSCLVAIILSANTKDEYVNRFTLTLLARPAYQLAKLLAYEDEAVREHLKSINLRFKKQATLKLLGAAYLSRPKCIYYYDQLVAIKGIGEKSAKVFLSAVHLTVGIGVDTHVARIYNRLVGSQLNRIKIAKTLEENVPKALWAEVNLKWVAHGRTTCTSSKPNCTACPIKQFCEHYIKNEQKT